VSRTVLYALFAASVSFGVGCSSSEEPTGPGPIKATADAPKGGVWVGLEPRIEGDKLVVDVVGHDVPGLSGVALRLEHPEWAKLEGRDVAPGWRGDVVHLVKEVGAKEISLVDAAKGREAGRDGGARVLLTTVRFALAGAPTSADLGALRIVKVRTELRDAAGKVVPAELAGAKLSR